MSKYDLKSVKLPRLAGGALRIVASLLENPITGAALTAQLLRDGGIIAFRAKRVTDSPTLMPRHRVAGSPAALPPDLEHMARQATDSKGFALTTTAHYRNAYLGGHSNPAQVAERVLSAIELSNFPQLKLRALIACDRADVMAQAEASAARWKAGAPLSVFDGVPVAVKDEVDMTPYPTTVGTKFLGAAPAKQDSTVVARMRAAGALLIGKANMHEIGIGVTGFNPHHGTTRNPYHLGHYTGGSSSGPGAAVGAGLCPVAIGADGGGSIRIPAAFCGAVGLKPTFGRVSEFGAAPLAWSVAHLGPIAATARDAAMAYAVLAGEDPRDPMTHDQPAVTLADFDNADLRGVRLGVYRQWLTHATPEIVATCEAMIAYYQSLGATLVDIEIEDLEAMRVAHLITIASEMATAMDGYDAEHRADFGLDVRINLALARTFKSRDYVLAQQWRTRAMAIFENVLSKVDMIVTPATGCPPPPIPVDSLPDGDSDLTTLTAIMRFIFPANLVGLPAITFPIGYTPNGLPLAMQLIGRAWQEHALLRLANLAERTVERRKPQVHYELL